MKWRFWGKRLGISGIQGHPALYKRALQIFLDECAKAQNRLQAGQNPVLLSQLVFLFNFFHRLSE